MIEQTVVNRRYRVDRPIGEGGMAVVYRGHDLLLGRDVAIKALRPQFSADAAFRLRFEREAQAAAGFAHPNIIDIYDVGEEDDTPYIVMAYVRGQPLNEIIAAEAPFHPDDVAALLGQLCSALDYAHDRGYVHRDVKPQNILVDGRGRALVVDFGIAKGLADSDLTEVGGGLGTVHYLSPEQASGLMATPASDVYAAGVVAFEMLTGRLPFVAETPVGVAMRHIHDPPPPPSSVGPRIPPAVDAIVLRALEKDPTRRFPTAGAFARAMADWRDDGATDRADSAMGPPIANPIAPDLERWGERRQRPAQPPTPRGRAGGSDLTATATPRRPSASGPAPRSSTVGDEIGCVTWIAGSAILLGLIGLIWLGVRLSDGGPAFGGAADPPTEAAVPIEPPVGAAPAGSEGQLTIEPAASEPPPASLVAAPQLIGLDLRAAEDAANGRGLLVSVGDDVGSASVPAGLVVEQEPRAAAEARQGETIVVRLSSGPVRIDLAALSLVGRTASEAEAMLQERGLLVERVEVASTDVAANAVAAIEPETAIEPVATVRLLVSVGNLVRIPAEIQGQPRDLVERRLTELGLPVREAIGVDRSVIEQFDVDLTTESIEDGDVVGIQGAEGVDFDAWVPPGTEVDLVYYDRARDRP